MGIRSAQILRRDLLARGGRYHRGTGDKHLTLLFHHDNQVRQGGGVDRAARAGTHDDGDLRDTSGRAGVAVENLPIAGQGVHRLLNAGAAGVAQAHHGAARLQSHVHDFADLGRVHLAQRPALGGKVLSVYKNRAPVDLAVTGNHAVGRDVLIPHTEGGTAVAHKAIHLCKSAGIHQQFNPFTGRPLPQRVLLLHRFRAAAPQHTGRMRVKLSQLFRRSHCPHFLSHNSSRTPWVALGWRKAIRAPPAPYRGVWSMSRTPFSFNSARAASMSSTRMAMC